MTRLLLSLLLAAVVHSVHAQPQDDGWERLVDLRGQWLFSLGDNPEWATPHFFDKDWERIFVPANWEDEGFWGYDGYAWYRRHFQLPMVPKDRPVYLDLGRIDDVGAVYVNGYFVGAVGRFPPEYMTGYHVRRRYRIPPAFLNVGERNVVAVRVYDARLGGGLVEGHPGLYAAPRGEPQPLLDLAGRWKFHTGDRRAWSDPAFDDADWGEVTVPGRWEPQGHAEYDGYVWYRIHFFIPAGFERDDVVLRLGKIDDLDEVFLNGRRIGKTGQIDTGELRGDEWQIVRAYAVPPGVLRYGAENVLAVRVYDGLYDGGIFEGPIGLVRHGDVGRWSSPTQHKPAGFWDVVWDVLFEKKEEH